MLPPWRQPCWPAAWLSLCRRQRFVPECDDEGYALSVVFAWRPCQACSGSDPSRPQHHGCGLQGLLQPDTHMRTVCSRSQSVPGRTPCRRSPGYAASLPATGRTAQPLAPSAALLDVWSMISVGPPPVVRYSTQLTSCAGNNPTPQARGTRGVGFDCNVDTGMQCFGSGIAVQCLCSDREAGVAGDCFAPGAAGRRCRGPCAAWSRRRRSGAGAGRPRGGSAPTTPPAPRPAATGAPGCASGRRARELSRSRPAWRVRPPAARGAV